MGWQWSTRVRDAQANAVETTIGTGAILKIIDGVKPANPAAATVGTVLATITLPSNYFTDSSSGVKVKVGTWEDPTADASGTARYVRMFASDGTTCDGQGDVTITGGTGSLTLDSLSITAGQPVTITGGTYTRGNA
jgi:hypothetical protein